MSAEEMRKLDAESKADKARIAELVAESKVLKTRIAELVDDYARHQQEMAAKERAHSESRLKWIRAIENAGVRPTA
jgi:cell division protein FtsB